MEFYMKYIIGLIVFFIVEILALSIGDLIGAGTTEIGYVVCAIALLAGVIVVCTLGIIDAINKKTDQ